MICPLHHNILGTGTGRHTGHLCPDALTNDRLTERPPCDSTCMYLDNFMADGMSDRCFAFHHELTAHKDLGPVSILMTVEEFSRNNTAEFFYLVYISVNCLLKHFINHLKVPGEIGTFQAAGQVDVDIKI
jgi:hypothetical protein